MNICSRKEGTKAGEKEKNVAEKEGTMKNAQKVNML
jgi:hypothetical protein